MSRLQSRSSFGGGGYYGAIGRDPNEVDPNLLFQAMSPYDRARLAERMSSPIYQSELRNRRAAEEQSKRFQDEQDQIKAARLEADARDRMFQQAEDAKRMDFQRQQALAQQQAENQWDQSRQQMTLQHNLGVMNADAARLDARDARSYQLRHPYLPGQSPQSQSDMRMKEFADQQEWQMAQKMFDQNIRKEDRFDTLKNQHLQEGWTHTPEDQALLQKLDEQVKVASQKMMAGEITKPQFAKYMELVRKQKEQMFPTQPPAASNQIANELYTDPNTGTTFYRNKRADGSYQIEHAPSGRGAQGGMGQPSDYRKTHQGILQRYNETYPPDPKTGKIAGPAFRDYLTEQLGTLLPDDAEPLAAQMGIPYKRPSLQPGTGGNPQADVINGTPPTAGPGNGGKSGYDAAMQVTPEDKAQRLKVAKGILPALQDGSHPYLAGAYAVDPLGARELHQQAANLLSEYQKTQNDDVWRQLEAIMSKLEKPSPNAKRLAPTGNAFERAGAHIKSGFETLMTPQSKTAGNVQVNVPGRTQQQPAASFEPQLNLEALDTLAGAATRDQQQEEDPQIIEYKIQELMDNGYSREDALRVLGIDNGSMQRYQRKR